MPERLTVEAAESCAAVHALCDPEYWSASEYAKLIGSMQAVGCMSEAGQLCGFLIFQGIEECIDVVYICVHPLFRRKKIAKGLMEYMFKSNPGADVFLEVRKDNAGAFDFYVGLDFKPINKRLNYYKDRSGSMDAIVLKRNRV
jgi:ribosomal protein S18 acetylase RimI-like enzyme